MVKLSNPTATMDQKNKKKKKKNSGPKGIAMKVEAPKPNPFETIWSRRKFDILGKKRKGEERRIGLARSIGIEKRKKTLLKEYEQSSKSSVFVDRRIGEQDDALPEFDKGILRSQRHRQMKLTKKSKFNLSDGEEDEGFEFEEESAMLKQLHAHKTQNPLESGKMNALKALVNKSIPNEQRKKDETKTPEEIAQEERERLEHLEVVIVDSDFSMWFPNISLGFLNIALDLANIKFHPEERQKRMLLAPEDASDEDNDDSEKPSTQRLRPIYLGMLLVIPSHSKKSLGLKRGWVDEILERRNENNSDSEAGDSSGDSETSDLEDDEEEEEEEEDDDDDDDEKEMGSRDPEKGKEKTPKSLEELCALLDNRSNTEIMLIINRIRASNAIKLAAENRKKMQVTSQSQKFCPEAIMFLQTLLMAATDRKPVSCQDSQYYHLIEFKALGPLLCIRDCVDEISPLNFIMIMDMPENSPFFSSDNFRVSVLLTMIETLQGYVNIYEGYSSFPEMFVPISMLLLDVAQQENLPIVLQDKFKHIAQLIKTKADEHHKLRRPLLMRKQKPVPMKMLNPKFEENFVKGRDYDPDRERAEKRKLKKLVKREAKGAARELRKDASFLLEVKEKERALREKERAEKYGKALAFLQEQEHNLKSGQLGKGRKRSR
uniref:Nucleolar protein 14 n=1 Tax=Fagus sylvatica TaxID=28930 RepID=A0A2N9EUF7_FAGSY